MDGSVLPESKKEKQQNKLNKYKLVKYDLPNHT